jgi:hypothetical protein
MQAVIYVTFVASALGEDAKPVVGPSFAQGSVKFQSVGVWSSEDGDVFGQLSDDFDRQQTIADDQPPTLGTNLAQIASKFVGAKFPSEESDVFAQLIDEFDDQQTLADDQPPSHGSNLAQITSKFVGAKFSSEIMDQRISDFASLDDAFDESTWHVGEEAEAFSVLTWLTNPYLYLTIALVLLGGLVATSPSSSTTIPHQPQPSQQEQTMPPVAQRLRLPEIDGAATSQLPVASRKAMVTADSVIEDNSLPLKTLAVDLPHIAVDSSIASSDNDLLQAASACRAGQPGSYGEFCRVLSESAQS